MKNCSKCNTLKPLSDFSPRPDRSNAFASHCKACRAAEASEKKRWRKWRAENPEKAKAIKDRFNAAHPGRQNELVYRWIEGHPAARKAVMMKRRDTSGLRHYTEADAVLIYRSQAGLCLYCEAPIEMTRKNHIDHMTPLSRGGNNHPSNICWTCGPCNRRKHCMTAEEFLAHR
jgi:hypothetical protein